MTTCLVTATIPRTIDLFLGPHMQRLCELGLKVHVASSERSVVADKLNLPFHTVKFSRSPFNLLAHFRAWRDYRRTIDELTASGETVLLHLHTPIAAALARLALRRSHPAKVLYMAHGFHFLPGERNLYYWIERLMARFTDLYVLINDADVISARELGQNDPERWVKIPGVGLQRVESDRLTAGKPASATATRRKKVLVVGILEKRKHPELAIQTAALLPDDVDMIFCGDGPMEAELGQLAKSLGRELQVKFEGWTEDVSPYFEQADCLLFLSEREGLPMTVAEAMASGLSVVAFDIRGVRDLLHGLNGWHIPEARTAEAVAIAVRAALDTPIDKEAYRYKASQFSLEASLAAHDAAVQRLLQNQPV